MREFYEKLKRNLKSNMSLYKKIVYYAVMALTFVLMLAFLAGKARILFLLLGAASFIAVRVAGGNRRRLAVIAACLFLFMAAGSAVYNRMNLRSILPFYRYDTQTFYNEAFLEEGFYPDAFLRLLLKDKTVYVKDDMYALDDFTLLPEYENTEKAKGRSYLYVYYHGRNTENFLKAFSKEVVRRESLNDVVIPSETRDENFIDMGSGNDMLRYTFLFNDFDGESANYFVYYWYYYTYLPESLHVYVNPEGMVQEDKLVALWDHEEVENIYIMSYDYYKREVAGQ